VADDITVSIGADDSALSQAIAKIKSSMAQLDAQAVALGKTISQAFAKMGITQAAGFKLAGPEEQNALAQYWASMEKGEGATKKLTAATKELGQAGRQTGIDFGAMAERMAARLVIFEAIRLAIQGIKYAVDQISNLQQAQIQFNATSGSVEELTTNFKSLQLEQKAALEPDIGKMVQVKNALEDFGMSERKAILETQDLAQWSKLLGVDAVKLAEALGRVSRGEDLEGTSGRLVTHMMGDQAAAGRALIQNLVELEKAQKRLETESAAVEKSMATQLRTTEQLGAAIERSRSRGQEFLKQTGVLQDIQAQLPKLARMPESVTPEFLQATGQLKLPTMPPGTSQIVRNQTKDYIAQYKEGLAEIQKEEGLTSMAMRALAPTLPTDYVMSKAKERHEDQMRNLREEDEATKAIIEGRKTAAGLAVTGAKAQIAAALPQAVTAPPTARWDEYLNSIKGVGDQAKAALDGKISDVVKGIGAAVEHLDKIRTADEGTLALLSGGT
jgi:hypothetical protein